MRGNIIAIKNAIYKTALLASTIVFVAGHASTETNYAGVNVVFAKYSEQGASDEASVPLLTGKLGTYFHENFAAEVRAGIGVGEDTVFVGNNQPVDFEIDSMFGAYLKAIIPLADTFNPYAVVGFTRAEVSVSAPGFGKVSDSDSDVSFGLGADIAIHDTAVFNFEYMSYFDKADAEITGLTIGIAKKF